MTEGPEDPGPDSTQLLTVELAHLGNYCHGFEDDFRGLFLGFPGGHTETLGGLEAVVSETHVAWIEDGIAVMVGLNDTANLDRFRPFLEGFAQRQADLPSPD